MSAPHTDPEDEKPKHRAPLMGMGAVVLFVGLLIIGILIYLVTSFEGPTRVAPTTAPEEGSVPDN
jgi:Na+-transporting methylmalonyl-CoA/oxaloacetate decarboxylase gamma subunit